MTAPSQNGHAPAIPAPPPRDPLARWCAAALAAIAALITAASAASFAESYRGLWLWARGHGLAGFWAAAFPAQVDVFIAAGELALFVALARSWPGRSRAAAWCVTLAGLAVSVAGNVGHVAGGGVASHVTAAVPPVAATAALAVGLGVLKRVVAPRRHDGGSAVVVADGTKALSGADRVRAILSRDPAMAKADVARAAGVSVRTVQRVQRARVPIAAAQ